MSTVSSLLRLLSPLLVLLSLCAASVSGAALYAGHTHPTGWNHTGRAPATSLHTVTLALQQRNLDVLQQAFANRTDPAHPHYQQWMTPAELHSYTALQPGEIQAILDWLTASGVQASSGASVQYVAGSDAIVVTAPVAQLEAAFSTQLSTYSHPDHSKHIIRQSLTASSQLPDHIAPLVEMTRGLTNFPVKLTRALAVDAAGNEWRPANPASSAYHKAPAGSSSKVGGHKFHDMQVVYEYSIVPINVLDRWYGFPDRSASRILDSPTISSGVYEPGNGYFSPADLSIYSYLQSSTQNRSFLSVPAGHLLGNANNPSQPGGEESLDIQAILSLNPQATPYYVLDGSGGDWYSFALWFQSFPNTQLPQTLSFSWVGTEVDYSCSADPSGCNGQIDGVVASTWFARVSTEYMKVRPPHCQHCTVSCLLTCCTLLLLTCCPPAVPVVSRVRVHRSACVASPSWPAAATGAPTASATCTACTPTTPAPTTCTSPSRRRRPTCCPSVARTCRARAAVSLRALSGAA